MLYFIENIKQGKVHWTKVFCIFIVELFLGNVFYFINKNEFLVGRRECDMLIGNDRAVSKKHALIRIKVSKHVRFCFIIHLQFWYRMAMSH